VDVDNVAAATPGSRTGERQAEAVRRVLPELRKLNRYEARTYATLDRALSELAALKAGPMHA
jgi:hypothetical protein